MYKIQLMKDYWLGWMFFLALATLIPCSAVLSASLDPPPRASSSTVPPISLRQVATQERMFVDSDGRQRFFHGINAVVKGPPWIPSVEGFNANTSLSQHDFSLLAGMGLNLVRLGVMWPGLEPQQGQFSAEYLDVVDWIVTQAGLNGIYTLFDMHQDLLSERFCGEGIPLWAVQLILDSPDAPPAMAHSFPVPVSSSPFPSSDYMSMNISNNNNNNNNNNTIIIPTRQACARHAWSDYYFSEADSAAFQLLYSQQNITQLWGRALGELAARFSGRPEVLGIELINEPWAGDIYASPPLLLPGVADLRTLQPAYQVVAAEVRARDDAVLLFFEGTTWSDLGFGFTEVPGGPAYANLSVVAFQYYVPPQLPGSEEFDFFAHIENARQLQCGYMLTEFGGVEYTRDFVQVARAADDNLLSWAVWEWKPYCEETAATLRGPSQDAAFGACKTGYGGISWQQGQDGVWDVVPLEQRALARAYPLAVAGNVSAMSFALDPATFAPGPFTLSFALDLACQLPTQIYISEAVYFANFSVAILPPSAAKYSHLTGSNFVYIIPSLFATQGLNVTVVITPQ